MRSKLASTRRFSTLSWIPSPLRLLLVLWLGGLIALSSPAQPEDLPTDDYNALLALARNVPNSKIEGEKPASFNAAVALRLERDQLDESRALIAVQRDLTTLAH